MNSDRSPFSKVILGLGAFLFVVTGLSLFWQQDGSGSPTPASGALHHTLATSASRVSPCRWIFDHYEASAYEKEWTAHPETMMGEDVCQVLARAEHAKRSQQIVGRVIELYSRRPEGRVHPVRGDTSSDVLFSRMHYSRQCWDVTAKQWAAASGVGEELIEPLWGMLRDPMDHWCGADRIPLEGWTGGTGGQSKSHILPSSFAPWTFTLEATRPSSPTWSTGSPPWQRSVHAVEDPELGTLFIPGKNIYHDLGSSYFTNWMGAIGAGSGEWFYNTYTKGNNLHFDRFVCVELEKLSPDEAYGQLPADLVAAYTLINVGLDTKVGSKLNAIDLLKSITKPGDFVVYKVDIDSAPIELPILHALRDSKELASRVSELMTEHHVDIKPMRSSWGFDLKESLKDSYDLFTALRANGIRAHSWP
ncbi:hypothetical protein RQP46_006487 [Phenoliferia psychrophenolica]